MHFEYANILVFMAFGVILCGLMMGLGALLRPSNPQRAKLTTYECGEEVEGDSWINFNSRFYLVALIFVVFDVEVAFFFPWAAIFGSSMQLADPRLEQRAEMSAKLLNQPVTAATEAISPETAMQIGW